MAALHILELKKNKLKEILIKRPTNNTKKQKNKNGKRQPKKNKERSIQKKRKRKRRNKRKGGKEREKEKRKGKLMRTQVKFTYFIYVTLPRAAKRFNSKQVTFLHTHTVTTLP